MKVMLYTDVHFSQYSSILRRRGQKYSQRLENIVSSMNWVENLAVAKGCDKVICLGDFFDKPTLNDEELTALQDIEWNKLPHTFVVGNHESSVNGLRYNSVNTLKTLGFDIINEVKIEDIDSKKQFVYLPYIIEDDRKPLRSYINNNKMNIILSHNDIKGIHYGKFESQAGFELSEIEANCALFLNGHLHNGSFLNDAETILNLGNLTGQNFSEDAFNYKHCCLILDTDSLSLEFYENPHAYNFYQVNINSSKDFSKIKGLKNAVVTFRCLETVVDDLRKELNNCDNVIEYRILSVAPEDTSVEVDIQALGKVDYLNQFANYIIDKLGNVTVVLEEVQEICKEITA